MATFNNGESLASVRTKINDAIDKVDGNATISNDIKLGDNNKAIFGAGSDLQIYHDGSHSFIKDTGVGDLYIFASDALKLVSAAGEGMATFNANGDVSLRYDNSVKLATTSTGVDITGTLTSDGLTVDGVTGEGINIGDVGNSVDRLIRFENSSGTAKAAIGTIQEATYGRKTLAFYTNNAGDDTTDIDLTKPRLAISRGGNISFYEDTGTTAKFFWDAAAESLGIGTTSPSNQLSLREITANTTTQLDQIRIQTESSGTTGVGFGSNIYFVGERSDGTLQGMGRIGFAASTNTSSNLSSDFIVQTASSGVAAERMRIDSSGNVGIGTSSPQTTLHIRKDDTAVVGLKLQNNTTNGIMEYQVGNDADNWFFGIDASDRFGISDVTGQASQKLVITQAGNVGIGTSSPATTLDVRGIITMDTKSDATNPRLVFDHDNFTGASFIEVDRGNNAMEFWNQGSEAMRIDSSGRVGIGTSDPSTPRRMDVLGSASDTYSTSNSITDNVVARFRNGSDSSTAQRYGGVSLESGNAQFAINTIQTGTYGGDLAIKTRTGASSYAERMRIDSSGNVGIGTSSPSQKLQVKTTGADTVISILSDNNQRSLLLFADTDDADIGAIVYDHTSNFMKFHANNTERMRIDSSGNLLVGTTSPILSAANRGNITLNGTSESIINLGVGGVQGGYLYQTATDLALWNTKNGPLRFATNNTETMRIDSSGRVGIGTGSPNNLLQINGGAADTALQITNSATGSTATDGFSITVENPTPDVVLRNREATAMRFLTSNSEAMRITSSGNVGIGTSSPATKLDVNGSAYIRAGSILGLYNTDNTNQYQIYNGGSSGANIGQLVFTQGGVAERMRIDSSGNVGIGVTSPAAGFLGRPALDVNGPVLARYSLNAHQTDAGVLEYSADETRIRSYGNTAGSGKIIFKTGGGGSADTERMRITSNGNVGIGTSSAGSAKLVVESNGSNLYLKQTTGDYGYIIGQNDADGALTFSRRDGGNTEHMRLSASGKVMVSSTSANGPFTAFNTGSAFNAGGWGNATITAYGSFGGAIALVDTQDINNTNAKGYIIYTSDTGNDFSIQQGSNKTTSTGGVYLNNAATSWSAISDEREKENLVNITNAVDNLKTLRTVKGNYIDHPDVTKAFLIAQDVNAFLPEAVSVRNKDAEEADQRLGLDYNQLIPVLVAAIKEQQATIETLEARLDALEGV